MNLLSAGYRVVERPVPADGMDSGFRRDDLVSMSECVATVLEDDWFRDLGQAQRRAAETGMQVIEVGFAADEAEPIVRELHSTHVVAGRIAEGVAPSGELLGFELVGQDCGLWHTWACLGGLADDVHGATGITPGRYGLIHDQDAAHIAARWLTASGLGDPKVFHWAAAGIYVPG
ncbi:hypothetical protein [Amycolatopsis jejuensis]|uniref:hypothetical protein n=1 Tax=Amycolatopsis jejuensis TaxID=330084 RepID=UPI000525337B|nr:hypothetical protein [Amycolatopsis jejuensis]